MDMKTIKALSALRYFEIALKKFHALEDENSIKANRNWMMDKFDREVATPTTTERDG